MPIPLRNLFCLVLCVFIISCDFQDNSTSNPPDNSVSKSIPLLSSLLDPYFICNFSDNQISKLKDGEILRWIDEQDMLHELHKSHFKQQILPMVKKGDLKAFMIQNIYPKQKNTSMDLIIIYPSETDSTFFEGAQFAILSNYHDEKSYQSKEEFERFFYENNLKGCSWSTCNLGQCAVGYTFPCFISNCNIYKTCKDQSGLSISFTSLFDF